MRFHVLLLARSITRPKARSNRNSPVTIQRPVRKVNEIVIKASSLVPTAQKDIDTISFKRLRLRDDVIEALQSMDIKQPTLIQSLAIPHVLNGRNVLCASETGSGKTVAYLAPLVNRLKDEEETLGYVTRLKKPRALILSPTRDLANQVLSVAKVFSHIVKVRALGLIGGRKRKFIKEALTKPVDIAVATPDSLIRLRQEERLSFSDVSHIILDEADSLFDQSFEESLFKILKMMKVREVKPKSYSDVRKDAQVTIVSATISKKMLTLLAEKVPNIKKISSKQLHKILPNVEQKFVKVIAEDKAEHLMKLLKSFSNTYSIVFCNSVPSCDWTARFIESNGMPVVKLHAGLNPLDRQTILKEFTKSKTKVLVCTDIASRGIDCTKVTKIIQFDWPRSMVDYLHRVGRTGRVGSTQKCQAIAFMTRVRDVKMAWTIKDSADQRDTFLHKKVQNALTNR